MFGIIRLLIGCIAFILIIYIVRKRVLINKQKLYILSLITSVILVIVLAFIPFENLFVTFNSPKEAYEYVNLGSSDIELVVSGNNSDLVIGDKNGTNIYLIVPKTSDGWKIGIGLNTKRIIQKVSNGVVVYVYQYKNTNDYFLSVIDTNGGESAVADSYNSKFYSLEKTNESLGKTFVTYFAYLESIEPQYWIVINGMKITLVSQ